MYMQGSIQWGGGQGEASPQILQLPSQNFKLPPKQKFLDRTLTCIIINL